MRLMFVGDQLAVDGETWMVRALDTCYIYGYI